MPVHHDTPRARRSVALALLAVLLGLNPLACRRAEAPPQGPEAQASEAAGAEVRAAPGLAIDAARMIADIQHLAADELRGRFTLSPELEVSARWIGERYRSLGLESYGGDFSAPFAMTTGVKMRGPATLAMVDRKGKARPVDANAFQPAPISGSASARGSAVFVGYGVEAPEIAGEDPKGPPAVPGYNDLAGVDLQGKVAVILLEAPNRPSLRALFSRLQREQEAFEAAIGGLREREDIAGIRKLHGEIRGRLVGLLRPFMPGAKLDDLWPLPEDPLALRLELQELLGVLMREAARLKGPRFDMNAGRLRSKVDRLVAAGAVGVVVVRGPRSFLDEGERAADEFEDLATSRPGDGEALKVPVIQIKWREADRLLRVKGKKISALQAEIDRDLRPRSGAIDGGEIELSAALEPITTSIPNVVAVLPGSDLADEIILLGAHYDHIGADDGVGECQAARDGAGERDAICNGADDNASGTAMLLEVARAWVARGVKPRRTLVFAHFAGEELGLRGSAAMAAEPPFPIGQVKAMVNLDMVGRLGPRGLAVGGLGSSDAWMPILDEIGAKGLSVLYESSVATRSDHASFYRKKIPVLFFFTGVHSDYHRPGDHADKINADGMQTIGEMVGEVTLALADGREIAYREPAQGDGLSRGLPGSDPATVVKKVKARRSAGDAGDEAAE